MYWIDGHLDLAYLAVRGRDLMQPCDDDQTGCIALPDLREGDVRIAFGTIFIEPESRDERYGYISSEDVDGAERAALRQVEMYESLERSGQALILRRRSDADAINAARIGIVILMEGADGIRSSDDVSRWFDRGVRIVGLTWAMGTRYAGGNARPGPLTGAGRDIVAALDQRGIAHDLSHLADEAADELLALAQGPVIASHSNCRSILVGEPAEPAPGVAPGAQRHIRDDHIRAIGDRDGIVGINLFTKFLAKDRRATIGHVLDHIEHVASIMGHCRGVALGSDADGGFPPGDLAEGLDHPRKWAALAEGLRGRGWNDQEIAGFAHGNWLRFLQSALPR